MSIQAIAWVLENSTASLGARLVLIAIASHADKQGDNAYPAVASLATEAGMSERQAQRAIKWLVEAGELEAKGTGGRGNTRAYRLPLMGDVSGKKGDKSAPLKGDISGDKKGDISGERVTFSPERVTNPAIKGVKNVTQTLREPLREPKKEPPIIPHSGGIDVKIGDDSASTSKKRAKPRSPFPADWIPDEQDTHFAEGEGRSPAWIAFEGPRCRDYHNGKGNLFADHHAAWRTWVRNAANFERGNGYGTGNLFGPVNGSRAHMPPNRGERPSVVEIMHRVAALNGDP